jgi:hypothetical protein
MAPRYEREPPALHPAIVGCLWHRGRVPDSAIAATVLSLIARGALEARSTTRQVTTIAGAHAVEVTEIRPDPARAAEMGPLDHELLAALQACVGGPVALSIADVRAAMHSRPATTRRELARWKASAEAETRALGLLRGMRRTAAGRREHDAHKAFFRYLRDFGTLHDEPPLAVELWGHYLAFAVLFGIGDRVAVELDLHSQDAAASPNLAVWRQWLTGR